jgi:imidazole glycerol-phosphate synthase subunit HisF
VLHKRLITILTFNDGVLFRTKLFTPDYRYTLNFVDAWSVDEIVILDVTRPGGGDPANFESVVRKFASQCFVPLSVGGGIRGMKDVRRMISLGADKVVVNTAMAERPELIGEIAKQYGSQCVVCSIDARQGPDGKYEALTHFATQGTGYEATAWARKAQDLGAGEILVTSVERDGALAGYDLELCRQVVGAVKIPVLISGGAGKWEHFVEGFAQGGASAVCTTNIYHFTEASICSAKAYLTRAQIPVRI